MIVLCDANILVRAAWSLSGPATEVVNRLGLPPHQLVASHVLLAEAERIRKEPRLRQRHGLDDATIETFILRIETLADLVIVPVSPPPVVVGDPLDDHVIFAAQDGRADVICSRDCHLFNPIVLEHCAQHGIRVLTDLELLAELRRNLAGQ
jgi:predicted nucleic acid-binding protein